MAPPNHGGVPWALLLGRKRACGEPDPKTINGNASNFGFKLLRIPDGPTMTQGVPEMAGDGSKIALDGPKMATRWLQDSAQSGLGTSRKKSQNTSQGWPKTAHGVPGMSPR